MQKPVEKPIKFIKNLLTKGKSYPITHTEAVIDNNGNTLSLILDGGGMKETTWQELKDKRDNGKLIPGSLYRITDYQCTTTQENTRSAGHQFDIVLLALSENKLAEEGWAMQHANDTYFANSNLSAWKVWYCLDNDKSRFAWADNGETPQIVDSDGTYTREPSEDITSLGLYAWEDKVGTLGVVYTKTEYPKVGDWNYDNVGDFNLSIGAVAGFGRGVIYRLIDEFNNDIKYDFKNIQFKRKLTDGQYDANGTETWCYTLNLWYDDMCQDASIVGNTLTDDEQNISGVHNNSFGCIRYDFPIEEPNTITFALGNNVILSIIEDSYYYGIYDNNFGEFFNNNTIGSGCDSNIIGNHSNGNIIRNGFRCNLIGNYFYGNSIGENFTQNVIGNSFINNDIDGVFAFNFVANSFGGITISSDTRGKNYGNNGVELATKNDIGNIETALSNI